MSLDGVVARGLSAYAGAALKRTDEKSASSAETSTAATSSASRALDAVAHSHKSVVAQSALAKQQAQLTSDLQAALSKAGLALTGEVSFTADANGAVKVAGNDEDRAKIATLLKNDASKPGLSQRVGGLVTSAARLSASLRDSAAWVRAARSAGRNGNAVDLYSTYSQTPDTTATTYRIDAKSGSLSYAGVLALQA